MRILRPATYAIALGVVAAMILLAAVHQRRAVAEYASGPVINEVVRLRFELAAAMQHPLGVGGIVAGHAASLMGSLAIAAMAAAHVGGEWTTGTVYSVLVRDPRRRRFVIAKFLSVWFAGVGVVVTTWAGLALLGPLFRAFYDVPPPPRGFSMVGFAVPSFFKALLVLAAFAAMGTLAGVLARHPLGAFGLSGAITIGFILASRLEMLCPALPSCWIASWMNYEREEALARHVWIAGAAARVSDTVAWIGLALLAVASVVMATWYVVRRDV